MRSPPRSGPARFLRTLALLAGSGIGVWSLAGCSDSHEKSAAVDRPVPRAMQSPPVWNSRNRPVTEQLPVGDGVRTSGADLLSKQTLHVADASNPTSLGMRADPLSTLDREPGRLFKVKYSANRANAQEVLRVLIGEFLQKQYLLDPKITGEVTLDIDQEMTPGDIMDLLAGVCSIYGWVVEDQFGILVVRPASTMARGPSMPVLTTRPATESDFPAIRVRTLRYISADAMTKVLQPIMSEGAQAVAVGRTLLMVDTIRQLAKVSRVLQAMDVPTFDGVTVWTYKLNSRSPEEAQRLLELIASGSKIGGAANAADALVQFVGIPGAGRLMVISRDETLQSMVQSWVQQVDQADTSTARFRYIYRVQNYDNAEKLVTVLQQFFDDRIEPIAVNGNPAQSGVHVGNRSRIVFDAEEKVLLIHATPDDYADMLATLRVLDRPRQQVFLSSVIAEVSRTDALKWGVEYFLRALNEKGLGVLELTGTPGLPDVASGGAFFIGSSGLAIVQALDQEADVNILSQPTVTVADGVKGMIQVGGQTPVVKGDIDSDFQQGGDTAIRRQIDYKDTGVILDVMPKINESGDVTLVIKQEINEVGQQTDLGPEFTTRKLETTVTVPHGKTLLLGGIISNTKRNTTTRIPLLGHIPIVGLAATSIDNRDVKSELILTITPVIVNEPGDGGIAMGEFITAAAEVRSALDLRLETLPTGFFAACPPEITPILTPESSEIPVDILDFTGPRMSDGAVPAKP